MTQMKFRIHRRRRLKRLKCRTTNSKNRRNVKTRMKIPALDWEKTMPSDMRITAANRRRLAGRPFARHVQEPVLEPLPSQGEEIQPGDEEPDGQGNDHLQIAGQMAPVDEGPRQRVRAVDLLIEKNARILRGQLEEPVERLEGAHRDEAGDDPAGIPAPGDRADDEEAREDVGRKLEALAEGLGRDGREAQELRAREFRREGLVEGVGPRRKDADEERRERHDLKGDEGEQGRKGVPRPFQPLLEPGIDRGLVVREDVGPGHRQHDEFDDQDGPFVDRRRGQGAEDEEGKKAVLDEPRRARPGSRRRPGHCRASRYLELHGSPCPDPFISPASGSRGSST